jgi:hypothetical protein
MGQEPEDMEWPVEPKPPRLTDEWEELDEPEEREGLERE